MNAKILYSVSSEKRKDMIKLISGIYAAKMVEKNMIELSLDWETDEDNDTIYIEFEDENQTRDVIYELFSKEQCDLTNKNIKVVFDSGSYYSDDENEELKRRLEEDDWDDNEENEKESVDEDCIAEGYYEYHGQSSGVISKIREEEKHMNEKEDKRFSLFGKKGKYDL